MTTRVKLRLAGRHLPIPNFVLRRMIAAEARRMTRTIAFMSAEHHAVRNFAVTELASSGAPVSPAHIAEVLALSPERVGDILDELEHHKLFVWRGDGEAVSWAYPVTCEPTPHRIEYAAAPPIYGA